MKIYSTPLKDDLNNFNKVTVQSPQRILEFGDKISGSKKNNSSCGNLCYCFLWPLITLGRLCLFIGKCIRNYVLPCCIFAPTVEKLKWGKIKDSVDEIYTLIITSQDELSKRQEQLDEAIKTLKNKSEKALVRFTEHIGHTIAAKKLNTSDYAVKEDWYNKNKDKIDFCDYFKIGNSELEVAVKSFSNEVHVKA